jgi:hypothetical protein
VEIDGFVRRPRNTRPATPLPLAWPPKDPGDTLDYVFDIGPALAANPGDAINTLDVVISPANAGDVTLAASSADGSKAILWLTGGQLQTEYAITLTITTVGGRSLVRTVGLAVTALSTVMAPPNALTTPGGTALTGPTGTPLTTS